MSMTSAYQNKSPAALAAAAAVIDMRVGIVCFASAGGSGVVATELGLELARRGHSVHFIAGSRPFRLPPRTPGVHFHPSQAPAHPLFTEPPHALALANAMIEVSREAGLDVIHVHYAVPHAAAACLARQALGRRAPALVATVHGSDVTAVGSHPGLAAVTAHCLNACDVIAAPSAYLREEARRRLNLEKPVTMIPNFVNPAVFRPHRDAELRRRYASDEERLVVHVSNFRPVKRVPEVVRIFASIARRAGARLLLVGDGPEKGDAEAAAGTLGVADRVAFLGHRADVTRILGIADLFLLPSLSESFGVAAAEAMACGVPVISSDVGGLRELVRHGETGYLCHPENREEMAELAVALLRDDELRRRMSRAAAWHVRARFTPARVVPLYEKAYAAALRLRAGDRPDDAAASPGAGQAAGQTVGSERSGCAETADGAGRSAASCCCTIGRQG